MSALRSEVDEWEAQPPQPLAQPQPAVLAEEGLDWGAYHVESGEVSACRFVLTREHPLGLIATQITMTGRGPRARVQVWWGRIRLAWAGLLLDDPRDRQHLADCAWERLHPSLMLIYPRAQLGRDLDHFCFGLWEAWESSQRAPVTNARAEIIGLRQQLGITDTSDLPERMSPADEQALLSHLRGLVGAA